MSTKPRDSDKPEGLTRPCRGMSSLLHDVNPDIEWSELLERWERRKREGRL